jgi:hypothetical protein
MTYEEITKLIKGKGYALGQCWTGLEIDINTVRIASLRNEGKVPTHYVYAIKGWLAEQEQINAGVVTFEIPRGATQIVLQRAESLK